MGLDMTAYRKVERIADWPADAEGIDDFAEYDVLRHSYVMDGRSVTYIHPSTREFPEHRAGMTAGVYAYTESTGWRAGSYSGYGEWRDWLSRAALGVSAEQVWRDFDAYRARGVAWLVNFSDCEGYIGAEVARRILDDIKANDVAIRANADPWYGEKLDDWLTGLEMAADGGLLEFH